MDDQRPCEMEYHSRVPSVNTYTRAIIRKRVWRKKEEEEKEVMQDERGGVPRGEKRLVGEEDDGGEQEGPRCAVLHKSISRGCINTTQ